MQVDSNVVQFVHLRSPILSIVVFDQGFERSPITSQAIPLSICAA